MSGGIMYACLMALHRVWARLSREDGQGLTEYALILALIALVAIVALSVLGNDVTSALSTVGNSI